MPRTSCLEQPKNDRYFVTRGHRIRTFRGNESICKIIAFFDWRTTGAISRKYGEHDDVPEDVTPWIECSIKEIEKDLLGTLAQKTIRDNIQIMLSLNVIEKREAEGKKNAYKLNVPLLNKWCRERHVIPEDALTPLKLVRQNDPDTPLKLARYPTKISEVPHYKQRGDPTKISEVGGMDIGEVNIEGVSFRRLDDDGRAAAAETQPSPSSPCSLQNPQTQESLSEAEVLPEPEAFNPRDPAAAHKDYIKISNTQKTYDLQEDTDVLEFVKNAYRQSPANGIGNAVIKRYADTLRREESSYSPAEFRYALWSFLADGDNPWLRENKWPLGRFLKTIPRYLPDTPPDVSARPFQQAITGAASAPEAPAPCLASSGAPAIDSAPICAANESTNTAEVRMPGVIPPNYLTYVDKWDNFNPDRPAGKLLSGTVKLLTAAIQNPDFSENYDELCRLCARLIASGEKTKFSWLFLVPYSGIPNWEATLQGKFDWLMKEKQLTLSEKMTAAIEKEEKEKNGK